MKATVVSAGRGILFYFKTYKEGKIKGNQTKYEISFVQKLRKIIPDRITVMIIGDRGFGRKSELVQEVENLGFYYVMRTK